MPDPSAPVPRSFGRFKLQRVLGIGAQATVWLGFDERLEREVAIKVLRGTNVADSSVQNQWLLEARSVSRLSHPNIVPLFEADRQDGQPYLVYELVPGGTLAEAIRKRGALPAQEAVSMMIDVLDALAAAHAAGVVHRDLKPSNILFDAAGRARVMDFGIAARLHDRTRAAEVVGTPCYMSPEAAQGLAPTVHMDLFAAGLVLAEMLGGQRVVDDRDPHKALHRILNEDLALPASVGTDVDDRLRAIVLRALDRDPQQRHASADAFRHALQLWARPVAATSDPTGGAASAGSGTLDFLLRRMRNKSDFPSLSDSVTRIQRVANSDNESLHSLSGEILKDVALTQKLLRLVNTANYGHAGGGSIGTVSRAVALVGFAGIRNLALSLVFIEHMQDKTHANELQEEFLRSLMAGSVAAELCGSAREGEEAFIGAMFQNLGRTLTQFYLTDEARQVRRMVESDTSGSAIANVMSEERASTQVLGLGYQELGLGVAARWGLPATLQRCMRKTLGEPPRCPPEQPGERTRLIACLSNELADVLLACPPETAQERLRTVGERYARALDLKPRDWQEAIGRARQKLAPLGSMMNLPNTAGTAFNRLLGLSHSLSPTAQDTSVAAHALQPTVRLPDPLTETRPAADILTAGIQDITNTMVESFELNQVLNMILETMWRAIGFRRIVFCLRDSRTDTLTGRFGMGEGAPQVAACFKVALKGGTDLLAAVTAKGADTLISDATVPTIAARLPAWYRQSVNAPAFLLLPLLVKGSPFALIYADKAEPGSIQLGEKELSLLRTLRNQAVMAFRQAG